MPVWGIYPRNSTSLTRPFLSGGARGVATRLGRMHDEALEFVPRIKVKDQHTADNGVV